MLSVLILAAGKSKRIVSSTSKILHNLGGRPLWTYPMSIAESLQPYEKIVVASSEDIAHFEGLQVVIQKNPLGTGHAAQVGVEALTDKSTDILILLGDAPLITAQTLKNMWMKMKNNPLTAVVVLGFYPTDTAFGYGRLLMNTECQLESIVEFRDAPSHLIQSQIPCHSGIILLSREYGVPLLQSLTSKNQAQEYYLTQVVDLAREKNLLSLVVFGDQEECLGINTRQDLARCEKILQNRWRVTAMDQGVTLLDPETVYFSYDTICAPDVTIHPNVILGPGVTLEKGSVIYPFSTLDNTYVGPGAQVGPFARLRKGTVLHEFVQIGNFVETKETVFNASSKAKHLSYIGNAHIEQSANIGAGTVTCNYDGHNKHQTRIGKEAFIGSNSTLVAPISIGDHALVAAGSTLTCDVPNQGRAFGRSKQQNYLPPDNNFP